MTWSFMGMDPGKMTGCATFVPTMETVPQAWEAPQDTFVDWAYDCLTAVPPSIILMERYTVTAETLRKSRGDNWSLEQIGVVRHLCRRHGHTFELQSPSDAKKLASNQRLRQLGWYVPGKGHANDALRHLLLGLARHGQLPDGVV